MPKPKKPKPLNSTDGPGLAIAYVRVSTDEQRLGPGVQGDAIAAWAARTGVQLVLSCFDLGVSGGDRLDKRPGLTLALAMLRPLGASILVVQKRDRLARDVMNAIVIEKLAAQSDATIVSTAGEGTGPDTEDDPAAMLLRRIVDVFSEYERMVICARTKCGMQRKRALRQWTGECPFGHRRAPGGLVPDAREQAALALLKQLHAEGMPLSHMPKRLSQHGFWSRRGTLFDIAQLRLLLKSEEFQRRA